jgi:UDP-N-acetylglucosamine diphosphorylase / glucose-1-phosphate thymidylyltransferase / UDP-N-acetylgalactosamine diphosphorylase / glucosamine-1-phosphate N-acetyltransferase / galactosamine-1-phosphate N-acetyltransferase
MIAVLSMAGRGSRFSEKGFDTPKPLIEVSGRPMVQWALDSIRGIDIKGLVVVALKEHDEQFNLKQYFKNLHYEVSFVLIDKVTEGQLCTVLEAAPAISDDDDILICPSDTYVTGDLGGDIEKLKAHGAEGVISVFDLPGDRWSFAETAADGWVKRVAEKERISNHASTGFYYFSHFGKFRMLAEAMIEANERTKGEFYIMPLYQKYIDSGSKVGISEAREMWDMGTPESKAYFEEHYHGSTE